MAACDNDKSFSVGWMFGGTVLMFIANLLGGVVAIGAEVTSMWILAAIGTVGFALAGLVIGWKSDGQAVLEAGLAAVISISLAAGLRGLAALAIDDPIALVVNLGAPLVAAIGAAWLGEALQGGAVELDDG